MSTAEGELLWEPSADWISRARITEFGRWLSARGGITAGSYDELWQWSIADLDAFWSAVAEWYGVQWAHRPTAALADARMPGAVWFPDGTLNYAQHLLFPPGGVDSDDPAVIFEREDGLAATLSWAQLREQVGAIRAVLVHHGVRAGDRVAALLPNSPHALIAMLATTSLGAIWSSCSPDFGPRAVADRFTQIEPVVLFAVDGYQYGGKRFDVRGNVEKLRTELPTLRATVLVPYLDPSATLPESRRWDDLLAATGELDFAPMPFAAPMWILYSSGTTGLPKAIVHSQGGILLEHVKQLALHVDLGTGDRFFWFSTTGWMMWNLLVSALALGAAVVLYDGSPTYPEADSLWQLAQRAEMSCFGVSAPYLTACMKQGLRPGATLDLSRLRSVGSTGAPLSPDAFEWVYAAVRADVVLNSLSGGTDVCTAFVGGAPTLPVHAGEISGRMLGCSVEAFDPYGKPLIDEVGELVLTAPMPSMPVAFWNDPDGARMREAYFDTYPGVWRHGDWIKITERGSCVIYGRSDSTLNRGGVRMGTAEFYSVVEELPGVADSLVIDTSAVGAEGRLVLFVVLADGVALDDIRDELRARIRANLSPRHVPDEIIPIPEVPRTLNGKKCEVPVKRVLGGIPLEQAVSPGALQNARAMEPFVAYAAAK